MTTAAIRSIAIGFPKTIRDNAWFRENQKDVVAQQETALAKMFAAKMAGDGSRTWDAAMTPYLTDPFRGTVERRVLAAGQSQIDLEHDVALEALAKANIALEDIDQILVSAFPAEHQMVGDAAYLAQKLGTKKPVFNIETTCSSALASLQVATAMIASGQAKNILVVVACCYSPTCDWSDATTWFLGDGVAAYVVGPAQEGEGFSAFHAINTSEACGAFEHRLEVHESGPRSIIRANAPAGRVLRDITPRSIRDVCSGVMKKAGVEVADVDFFVTNTPVAWFPETFADTLGVPVTKLVSTYTEYANVGPALNPINLHRSLSRGLIKPGDLVLMFTIGSVSNAAAALMHVGDIAVGAVLER